MCAMMTVDVVTVAPFRGTVGLKIFDGRLLPLRRLEPRHSMGLVLIGMRAGAHLPDHIVLRVRGYRDNMLVRTDAGARVDIGMRSGSSTMIAHLSFVGRVAERPVMMLVIRPRQRHGKIVQHTSPSV